jgi:hypothetical protein
VGIKLGEEHRNKLYALQFVTGKLEVTSVVWFICFMEIAEREKSHKFNEQADNFKCSYWPLNSVKKHIADFK